VARLGEDLRTRPCSTTAPSFITTTRWAVAAHDGEVVGDEQHRHAEPLLESAMSWRICAWMVTSSAVVGSSAISSSGSLASAARSSRAGAGPPESWCG
jgi:hypothetical protein